MSDNKSSTRKSKSKPTSDKEKRRRKADRKKEPENSIYKNLPTNFTFRGKTGHAYRVKRKLGEGGMGAVYEVEDQKSGKRYAIKCEGLRKYKQMHLSMEKVIYKGLNSPNWPKFYDQGKFKSFYWLAMQLVGPTLQSRLRESPTKRFSGPTCLIIAIHALNALQSLHDLGFLHRDLKPDNIATGLGDLSRQIILFDAGIARRYRNSDGTWHRPRNKIRFKGTRQFAPLCMHKKTEYGPRDDVESFLYVMATFSTGGLPWKGKRPEELQGEKEAVRNNPQALFHNTQVSEVFSLLWTYVAGLRYEDPVDYGYMSQLLRAALNDLGGDDVNFDWERPHTDPTRTIK